MRYLLLHLRRTMESSALEGASCSDWDGVLSHEPTTSRESAPWAQGAASSRRPRLSIQSTRLRENSACRIRQRERERAPTSWERGEQLAQKRARLRKRATTFFHHCCLLRSRVPVIKRVSSPARRVSSLDDLRTASFTEKTQRATSPEFAS